jgi:hypothetical protein
VITVNIYGPGYNLKSRDAFEEGKHERGDDAKFGSGSTASLHSGHKAAKSDAGRPGVMSRS